jgi:hypothetical protein
MHSWNDTSVDWKGIGDAATYIDKELRTYARINVRGSKEKWGTVRVYCDFGWYNLHSILYPGYHWTRRFHTWFADLDNRYLWQLVSLLNIVVVPFHKRFYRKTYRRAIHKWPHLRKEILAGADHSELLAGL